METKEIIGSNYCGKYSNSRIACRAFIFENGKFLMSFEGNGERWFTPGGGIEKGETLEQCCIREVAEETGSIVRVEKEILVINEYFSDWFCVNHYFVCKVIGKTERAPTETETENKQEPIWIEADRLVMLLKEKVDSGKEIASTAQKRELLAIEKFLEIENS